MAVSGRWFVGLLVGERCETRDNKGRKKSRLKRDSARWLINMTRSRFSPRPTGSSHRRRRRRRRLQPTDEQRMDTLLRMANS